MPSRLPRVPPPRPSRSPRPDECGQAAVELVAVLPFVALLALVLWQLAMAGQAAWMAGAAARVRGRAGARWRAERGKASGSCPHPWGWKRVWDWIVVRRRVPATPGTSSFTRTAPSRPAET